MEQSDKPLFVALRLSGLRQIVSLPGLFLTIPLATSGCTSCTVVLVALDVDNFSCRSIILQKFSFSKFYLLCLISIASQHLASYLRYLSQLAISDVLTSFEGLNLFLHSYPFLFLTPHLAPYLPPAKVLPWHLVR